MARCTLWMGMLGQLLTLVAGQVPQRQRPAVRVEFEVLGYVMGKVALRCQLVRQTSEVTKVTWSRATNDRRQELAVYESGLRPWYPLEPNSGRLAFRELPPKLDATLTIQSLIPQDGGTYFCTFTFSNRTEEAQTRLIVAVEPVNSAEAVPAEANVTQIVVVAICTSASGYPPSAITWFSEELLFNAITIETNNTDGTVTVQSQLWMTPRIEDNNKTATCVINRSTTKVSESIAVVLTIRCQNSTDQSTLIYRRLVWGPKVSIWVCGGLLGTIALICFIIFYAVCQRSSSSKTYGVQTDTQEDRAMTALSTKV